MTVMMREALKPNLLQTLENTPVFVHAGRSATSRTATPSVVADLIGIHTGDFLVTEAGFGADMGAERFFNIKCRVSGLKPDAAVVVATVRALKSHSGKYRVVAGRPLPEDMLKENPEDVAIGAANLRKQMENIRAARRRAGRRDQRDAEGLRLRTRGDPRARRVHGRPVRVVHPLRRRRPRRHRDRRGGRRGRRASRAASTTCTRREATLREKIEAVATKVYGADGVDYTPAREQAARRLREERLRQPPGLHRQDPVQPRVHDATSRARPPASASRSARSARLVGAGFIYPICGDMRTMPGLASKPAAISIDLDEDGNIVGLY